MATHDQRAALPASVTVLFPRQDSGVPAVAPTAYTVPLNTALAVPGAASPPLGHTGAKVLWSSAVASWAGGGSPSNNTELQALANQIAQDWYAWQLASLDASYAGMVPWVPDGGHDVVVEHNEILGACQTRSVRGAWNDHIEFLAGKSSGGSSPPGPGNNYNSTTINVSGSTVNIGGASTVNVGGTTNTTYGGSTTTTYSGSLIIQGPFYQPHYSFASWTGNQTDLSLSGIGNVRLRVASDAHYRELRSLVPGSSPSGRVVYLHNVGSYVILIAHQDSGSTAANRIITTTGNYYWLAPGHCVALVYDSTSSRWRVSENSDERLHGIGTDYALTADVADLDLDRDKLQHRITPDVAGWTISGIAGGQPGLKYHLINGSDADSFTLLHNDVGSSAANRFFLPNGDDVEIPPRAACIIEYEGNDDRWRLHFIPQASTASLTNTYVGYGSGANLLTGTEDFTRVAEGQVYIKTDDDSTSPSLTLRRRRNGSADVDTGDIMGEVVYQGYLAGDQPQAYVRGRYTGNGTTAGGQIELVTVNSSNVATNAIIIDQNALVYVDTANNTTELVGTGSSGELVNVQLGYLLKRSSTTLDKKFRGARAYESVTSNTYAPTTWTSIPLDAENYDTDSMHDNATNNSRLTIPTGMGGYWDFRGFYYPDTNGNAAGTVVQVRIMLNGATVLAQSIGHIDTSGAVAVSPIFDIRSVSAGDYVELQVYHTGGANMKGYGNDILAFLLASFVGVAP